MVVWSDKWVVELYGKMAEETQLSEDHHNPLKTLMNQVVMVVEEKGTDPIEKVSSIMFCIYGHWSVW